MIHMLRGAELPILTSSAVLLLTRREVYRILLEEGIDLPRYVVLNRDPDRPEGNHLQHQRGPSPSTGL